MKLEAKAREVLPEGWTLTEELLEEKPASIYVSNGVGHFRLTRFPGNSSFLVLSKLVVNSDHLRQGNGVRLVKAAIEIGKNLQVSGILMVVKEENVAMISLIRKHFPVANFQLAAAGELGKRAFLKIIWV